MRVVVFSELANSQLIEAYQWYEEQKIGLGDKFLEQLYDKADNIGENPYYTN